MEPDGRSHHLRTAVGVLGELLITAGVVVGLFAVYTLFWTGVETQNAQSALQEQFEALSSGDVLSSEPRTDPGSGDSRDDSAQVRPQLEPGDAYARMRIPRLGDGWSWIVVEGVDLDDLTRGPGRYPESADVGDIGNFAVAGHRATYGEPFAYLDRVQAGDDVLVEREGSVYRYVVTDSFITVPSNTDVLLPVPGQPGATAENAVITLTTCHPRWGSTERLILHGTLASVEPAGGDA